MVPRAREGGMMRRYWITKEVPHRWNNYETCWALYDRVELADDGLSWHHVLDFDTWQEAIDFIDERIRVA